MKGIIDTTLREGEQTTGVSFTFADKKRVIERLILCGVDEIELGFVNPHANDLSALCSFFRNVYPHRPFSLWCRCLVPDIRLAAALQPDILALSIPASDLHLTVKLGKDRTWAVKQLRQAVKTALKAGIQKISVGLEDASRADPAFINTLAHTAETAGAFRLRLADTVGIASPADIIRMLDNCQFGRMESGIHCHNDFGMATANTITALEHGADWADVTSLGLGERAGNSRLEEVLAYLAIRKNKAGYKTDQIPRLSRLTAQLSKQNIPPNRPIIGNELFACETGLHLHGLESDPATYEPFDPALVGNSRKMFVGQKAGCSSIAASLKRLGIPIPDTSGLIRVTQDIRSLAKNLGRPLKDKEIIRITISSTRYRQTPSPASAIPQEL